jgi:CHAD domain-containing protein
LTYHIRPGRDLTDEVARVARDQYKKAIGILGATGDERHKAVHDARKRFKKLRGLFRLVRKASPDFYERENARLRDTAGTLSTMRDATALVETMDRLYGTALPPDDLAVLLAIRHRFAARRDAIAASESGLDERMAEAIGECRNGIDALKKLSLPGSRKKAAKLLAGGFAKTYGRARDDWVMAKESGAAADWHDLRKRVKYHWMHVKLLRPLWPGQMRLRATAAKRRGRVAWSGS